MGPVGTGKTTLQSYLVDHLLHSDQNYTAYWLMFRSVKKYYDRELDKAMPETIRKRLISVSNPNDKLIWWDDEKKTESQIMKWLSSEKILVGDEISRFMDRYSNVKVATRQFGHLVAAIRQKNMHGIFADQSFDFPVAVKEKGTLWFFTGLNEFTGKKLQNVVTTKLQRWFDWNTHRLIALGDFNSYNLKTNGWGIAIVTNGNHTWRLDFKRPSWYTLELSEILKYLKPEDIFIEDENEGRSINVEGRLFKCLLFAYHYMKDRNYKASCDLLNDLYFMGSPVFFDGEYRELPSGGRAFLRKAVAVCKTEKCPYCMNPEIYRDKLAELVNSRSFSKPTINKEVQAEIYDLLGELPE